MIQPITGVRLIVREPEAKRGSELLQDMKKQDR